MSLISYIKRDRDFSFNFWRYRLLHWTFGIEKPKSAHLSPLPMFLYTHYCPLFHLTNILVIMMPLILLFKMGVATILGILNLGDFLIFKVFKPYVVEPIKKFREYLAKKDKEQMKKYLSSPEYKALQEKEGIQREKKRLKDWCNEHDCDDLMIKYLIDSRLNYLDKDEAMRIFEKLKAKKEATAKRLEENRLKAEARKKELAERMVFWIRFSQLFVKGLTIAVIVSAVLAVIYGLILAGPPVWWFLCYVAAGLWWLLTEAWVLLTSTSISSVLSFLWKTLVFLVGVAIGGFALAKIGPRVLNAVLDFFSTPLSIVGQCFEATTGAIANGVSSGAEFFAALYEDNCPTINIVSEEGED